MSVAEISFAQRVQRRVRGEFNHLQRRYHRQFVPGLFRLIYQLPTVELASLVSPEIEAGTPILDDVCMLPYCPIPDYYPNCDGYDDLSALMRIVRTMQPKIVVE